jgi:hypothetical protein
LAGRAADGATEKEIAMSVSKRRGVAGQTPDTKEEEVLEVTGGTFTYTGGAHPATVTVTVGERVKQDPQVMLRYTDSSGNQSEVAPTSAGTYTATAEYHDLTATATLTITPAPLVVVAPNVSVEYGQPIPPLEATISTNFDGITATVATPPSQGVALPAGTHQLIPTLVDNNGTIRNYTPTRITGTLTVRPIALAANKAHLFHELRKSVAQAAGHVASAGATLSRVEAELAQFGFHEPVPVLPPPPAPSEFRLSFEGVPAGETASVRVFRGKKLIDVLDTPDASGGFTYPAKAGDELDFESLVDGVPFERIRLKA